MVARLVILALLWWALSGGAPAGWGLGVPIILSAAATAWALGRPRSRLRLLAAARLLAFFLRESLRAGVDVARRALAPAMPLAPGLVECPLRLTDPSARLFLASIVGLLPGTCTVALDGDRLTVHALDARRPVLDEVRAIEERVGAAFGDAAAGRPVAA
jgi:multicomponent Na+:H+ antiporter subunit E